MSFNPMSGRAGKLYRDITPAEIAMEEAIAKLGVPYRIQFPYYLWGVRFFPDFLLPTLGLIIEVDDKSHREKDKIIADEQRTQELNALGWTVLRCTNEEVLYDATGVLRNLLAQVGQSNQIRPLRSLAAGLPQRVNPGKKTRGTLRQEKLSRKSQTVPQLIPRRKSSPQMAVN
jgi:very-short-patch-repair endonuclease